MSESVFDVVGRVPALAQNLVRRACIGDVPTRGAQHYGDRVAIVDGNESVSYRQLEARANSVARGLLAEGLGRGDRLAIVAPNSWQFVVTYLACAKTGVVFMPINLGLSPEEISYQLVDAAVAAVVVDETILGRVQDAVQRASLAPRLFVLGAGGVIDGPSTGWDQLLEHDPSAVEVIVEDTDVVHCLYTSGTTSSPKGVLTSHSSVLIAILASVIEFQHRRDVHGSVMPIVLPMFHVTALDALMMPVLASGGTALLYRSFDAAVIVDDLERRDVSHLVLLPMMWEALLAEIHRRHVKPESLRRGVYAMAPMSLESLDALRQAFPGADFVLASGMTETTPTSEMQWAGHQRDKHGAWGSPSITSDVRIMGQDGTILGPGEMGEIVYRTPQLMTEYWNKPEANGEAFAHGWFHSGDVGYVDQDGVVWFADRLKDIVKSGGENVSTLEVEQVVGAFPGVRECAVIGRPHERWGEAVTAVVVPDNGVDIDEAALTGFCKERLAGYKVPKEVVLLEALPRTQTGKVEKHKLRHTLRAL